MFEEIDLIVNTTFNQDLGTEIKKSFKLFELFTYPDYEVDFLDLSARRDYISTAQFQDEFILITHSKLNYLLQLHKLVLADDTRLDKKNKILDALYLVQDLDNYGYIIPILESSLEPEEKVSSVLAQLCALPEVEIFSLIESVDESFISVLKEVAYKKELKDPTLSSVPLEIKNKIIVRMQEFKAWMGDEPTLGVVMAGDSIILGLPVKKYLKYLGDILNNKAPYTIALHLYSLLLLTEEGRSNPLGAFRELNSLFFSDINSVSKIDIELVRVDQAFNTYLMKQEIEG